ncbi:MAG: sigma-70 family RNA polymerase sigma factor [Longimicrobiales bacterium]
METALLREYEVGGESELPVEELVRKAQKGDDAAFEAVYRTSVERIYALCLRMSGDSAVAEELTQDVFVRAWQKLSSFRGESRFSTWLHRLAVNLVLQDRRSKGRRRAKEEVVADLERYGSHAQRAMPGTRVDLERAIAGLPTKAREVLVLRDIQGYKYDEIAGLTGVSLGTVKAQIHRARALVREALEK